MAQRQKLLEVKGLKTYFDVEGQTAKAVDGVDFFIYENEVFGLVGESGSGKSVTALSILRLIPNPPGRIEAGEIRFQGENLLELSYKDMRKLRGNDISMIFQEPMTALNPVFSVGFQLREAIQQPLDKVKEKIDKVRCKDLHASVYHLQSGALLLLQRTPDAKEAAELLKQA